MTRTVRLRGIVGSRTLPVDARADIEAVVRLVVKRGARVVSGGALGADLYALIALVHLGESACRGSQIVLPWDSWSGAPGASHRWLREFDRLGGEIVLGTAASGASREVVVQAIRVRNAEIARRVAQTHGVLVPFSLVPLTAGTRSTINAARDRSVPIWSPRQIDRVQGLGLPAANYWSPS